MRYLGSNYEQKPRNIMIMMSKDRSRCRVDLPSWRTSCVLSKALPRGRPARGSECRKGQNDPAQGRAALLEPGAQTSLRSLV